MTDQSPFIQIAAGSADIQVLAFSTNGEHLYVGGSDGIQVLRAEDGKKVGSMQCGAVRYLAVSEDGRWIAAGTEQGRGVSVWNATTYDKAWEESEENYGSSISVVDFAPDSTQLVIAYSNQAIIWNVTPFQRYFSLWHEEDVITAKYSPRSDRIATATDEAVYIYGGSSILDIIMQVPLKHTTGLLWSNNQSLSVLSNNIIKEIDLSIKSILSEWTLSGDSDCYPCIFLPQHQDLVVCSAKQKITLLHKLAHRQVGSIEHGQFPAHSIALSPDGRFIGIGGLGGEIIIKELSRVVEPAVLVDSEVLDSWKNGKLIDTENLLSAVISASPSPNHEFFAYRALIRSRLQSWDRAIDDVIKSIEIQPSSIGYIAKGIALAGKGKRHEAYRACDTAFEYPNSSASWLLLIKAIVVFMAGEHDDAISRVGDLISTAGFDGTCHVIQMYMYLFMAKSRMDKGDYEGAVRSFEQALARTQCNANALHFISMMFGWDFKDSDVAFRRHYCEALYAKRCIKEAEILLLEIVHTVDISADVSTAEWVSDFTRRYLSTSDSGGSTSLNVRECEEVPSAPPSTDAMIPISLLREWIKATTVGNSWRDVIAAAVDFTVLPRFIVYQELCEYLEATDHILEASDCVRQVVDKLVGQTTTYDQHTWIIAKLENFGDYAMDAGQYDDAISEYSIALSLDPISPHLLVKRSDAYNAKGLWEDALNDAEKAILIEPSSPWGYQRKHAALHSVEDYGKAIDALETMILKIKQSSDAKIRDCYGRYQDPEETRTEIRLVVENIVRDLPRVLIDTAHGRLHDKAEQASAFESLPLFKVLVSSMTSYIDYVRIEQSVEEHYRYAMFSHRWQDNEPVFDKMMQTTVYDLEKSPAHDKLQMFCKLVRDAGFNWAWSDTCCINKSDRFILQEALVAMFRWYEGAALTIVYLLGVQCPSQPGDLVQSIWNTRAWTFQEYHASQVVRFYTQDWKPYLGLSILNHKDSPEVISEMEKVTDVSAEALVALRPGLNGIREKLCLASRRKTTLVEDAAYSLFGIFSVSLPIVYGEGHKALGRLLAQLLTNSGDASILAWTGVQSTFNSCLPTNITVFDKLPTTHIPSPIENIKMKEIIARLYNSSLDPSLVMMLYDQVHGLPMPWFSGQRMKLPCITFKVSHVIAHRGSVFRAKATGLGLVEIRTANDLSLLDSLILVHPWIDFLLDRQPIKAFSSVQRRTKSTTSAISYASDATAYSLIEAPDDAPPIAQPTTSRFAGFGWQFGSVRIPSTVPLSPSADAVLTERYVQALEFMARLREPFGALLLYRTRRNVEEYMRVAADSVIMVQIREDAMALSELISGVRVLDVL